MFFLASIMLITTSKAQDSDQQNQVDPETRQKFEAMLNILCNIETKKFLLTNAAELESIIKEPIWEKFSNKITVILMKECLVDLNNPQLLNSIIQATTEEQRRKVKFDFFERVKISDVRQIKDLEINEEEKLLLELYERIEKEIKKDKDNNQKPSEESNTDAEENQQKQSREFHGVEESEL